jgi:hypothetical protein
MMMRFARVYEVFEKAGSAIFVTKQMCLRVARLFELCDEMLETLKICGYV